MTVSSELEREMGRRVDALLKLGGVTRRDLATLLGKDPTSIGHKLANVRGRSLNKWEVLATAEWLNVGVGVLYGTEPMPSRVTARALPFTGVVSSDPFGRTQNLKWLAAEDDLAAQLCGV